MPKTWAWPQHQYFISYEVSQGDLSSSPKQKSKKLKNVALGSKHTSSFQTFGLYFYKVYKVKFHSFKKEESILSILNPAFFTKLRSCCMKNMAC